MASLQQACPLPLHPYPKKTGNGNHKTRKNTLSGYIFILQDDYLKVTFLNCLTGQAMPVFDEKQDELEHYETMMGVPRGRLAVTMDMITDAMALVGQHGVYCQSQRWPGKPVLDIQLVMKGLTDAKELIQSVMVELGKQAQKTG